MNKINRAKYVLLILILNATVVYSNAINLSGTVYGGDNKPFKGMAVSLVQAGLSDTTGADGKWQISEAITKNVNVLPYLNTKYSLKYGLIPIELMNTILFKIDLF